MTRYLFVLFTLFWTVNVHADNQKQYNLIHLSATAKQDIDNDQLTAIIQILESGNNPSRLTNELNRKAANISQISQRYDTVNMQSDRYQSRPIYKDGKIISWQVSQHIRFTSQDFAQTSELLANVNDLATIHAIQFNLSDRLQQQLKTSLTTEAIQLFKNKAAHIGKQFGSDGYKLVTINVDHGGMAPMPMMERSMMMADSRSKTAPPSLSPGTNQVSVTVSGTVQLNMEGWLPTTP